MIYYPGDLVKLIKDTTGNTPEAVGKIGIVTHSFLDGAIIVHFSGLENVLQCYVEELRKVRIKGAK